jgi:hypothetical protein
MQRARTHEKVHPLVTQLLERIFAVSAALLVHFACYIEGFVSRIARKIGEMSEKKISSDETTRRRTVISVPVVLHQHHKHWFPGPDEAILLHSGC